MWQLGRTLTTWLFCDYYLAIPIKSFAWMTGPKCQRLMLVCFPKVAEQIDQLTLTHKTLISLPEKSIPLLVLRALREDLAVAVGGLLLVDLL